MPPQSGSTSELVPSGGTVHVVGAGPVGLLLTALLQSMDGFSVRLYEKRHEYTRTRMVQLAPVPRRGLASRATGRIASTATTSRPSSIRESSRTDSRSGSRSRPI